MMDGSAKPLGSTAALGVPPVSVPRAPEPSGTIPVNETTSDHSIKSTIYASTVKEHGGINGIFGIYLGYIIWDIFLDIPGAFTCCLCVFGLVQYPFLAPLFEKQPPEGSLSRSWCESKRQKSSSSYGPKQGYPLVMSK